MFPYVFFPLFQMSWKTPKYIEADYPLRCCQLHVWHWVFPTLHPSHSKGISYLPTLEDCWICSSFILCNIIQKWCHFELCISHFKSFLTTLYFGVQAFFLLFTQFARCVLCLTTGTFPHCCATVNDFLELSSPVRSPN